MAARGPGGKWNAFICVLTYLAEFVGLKTKPRQLRIPLRTITILINTSRRDIVGYWEVWLEREYSPIPAFETNDGDIVVDVGTNVGFHVLHRARSTPSGRVFAFEPDPISYEMLTRNLEANGIANVTCANVAVSDAPGELSFISHRLSLQSRVVPNGTPGAVRVPCTTLDAVVKETGLARIDLLKIDTEGHELNVIRGGLRAALPITSRIALEYHSLEDKIEITRLLREHGFDLAREGDNLLFLTRRAGNAVSK